jgi:hypothetical protein
MIIAFTQCSFEPAMMPNAPQQKKDLILTAVLSACLIVCLPYCLPGLLSSWLCALGGAPTTRKPRPAGSAWLTKACVLFASCRAGGEEIP